MSVLCFIPALLEGNYDAFFVKLSIVILMWLLVIAASMVDLITGIAASKRTGTKHTTSWGLRRTLSKDLQYLALLFMMLLIDIGLSSLGSYVVFFSTSICSFVSSIAIVIIEAISVAENIRRGRSPEEDKIDDIHELVMNTVDALGSEKTKAFLEALQKYQENKKA
jgi:hypothetical protein